MSELKSDRAYLAGLNRGYALGVAGREQDFQTENNAYRSQVNALCPTNDEPTPRELLEALVIDREANHARITELETRLRDIGDIAHAQSTGPAEPDWLWQIRELAYELL